jgi:hypothetical protein
VDSSASQYNPDDFSLQHLPEAFHDRPSLTIPEGSNVNDTQQASDPEVDHR